MFTQKEIEILNSLHKYFPSMRDLSNFGGNIEQIQNSTVGAEYYLEYDSPNENKLFEGNLFVKNIEIDIIEEFDDINSYFQIKDENNKILVDKNKSDLSLLGKYISNLNYNIVKIFYNLYRGNSIKGKINIKIS